MTSFTAVWHSNTHRWYGLRQLAYVMCMLALCSSPGKLVAQSVDGWTAGGRTLPWTLGRTVVDEVTGYSYEISVALPRDYDVQPGTYPVLYAMDAGNRFGTITEISRANISSLIAPGVIVVGIGYEAGGSWDEVGLQRNRDLTPRVDQQSFKAARPHVPIPVEREGADDMLRFMREQLFPLIEQEYRADAGNRALLGHSLAGLFALYTLMTSPDMFQNYIVSSPSLWWNEQLMLDLEKALVLPPLRGQTRLFMSMGSEEIPQGMIRPFDDYVAALESSAHPLLNFEWRLFDGENHGSVVPTAFSNGFRFVYGERNH